MASEQIHIWRKKVIETKTYKDLSFIQRKMVITRNNLKQIEHCMVVIEHIGFDQWKKISNPNYTNKLIIKDLNGFLL